MVGVPGRSGGCATCRSRKKGCDKRRPACTQCLSTGIACEGYERVAVFVNRTQAMGRASVAYRLTLSDRPGASSTQLAQAATPPVIGRGQQNITLQTSLAQTAYNLRYMESFWSVYLPGGQRYSTGATRLSHGGWINAAQDLYTADKSLQLAMQAVAFRGLGIRCGDQQMIEQGLTAYTKCLSELHLALSDARRVRNDSLLCTAKLLSTIEMHYADPNDELAQYKGWIAHANGQLAILATREPREFRSGKAHQLFADYRYALVVSAVTDRKRFALNSKGWKTTPWKSQRKTPLDQLIDVLGDLSGVMEDIDGLHKRDNTMPSTIAVKEQITQTCWHLDRQLQTWASNIEPLKTFNDLDQDGPTNTEDFALAHLTILYWATCTLLYANLSLLTTEVPPRMKPDRFASEVASAVAFFTSPAAGELGLAVASFPIGSVYHIVSQTANVTPEQHRQFGLFFCSQNERQRAIATFLMSLRRGAQRQTGTIHTVNGGGVM